MLLSSVKLLMQAAKVSKITAVDSPTTNLRCLVTEKVPELAALLAEPLLRVDLRRSHLVPFQNGNSNQCSLGKQWGHRNPVTMEVAVA